jgi:S-adenosylmethionine decarboxylase proenzyme
VTAPADYGKHWLVDFHGCDPEGLRVVGPVREAFLQAAREARATLVDEAFHQFEPEGVSGVLLIAESHLSVHTWPEDGFAAVDIFTCGEEMDAEVAVHFLERAFRAQRTEVRVLTRGRLGQPEEEPRTRG